MTSTGKGHSCSSGGIRIPGQQLQSSCASRDFSVLGWKEEINVEEALKLDIYLFIIESIRIEDQNQGAFFLKRFLQGPQEIWNKTQESIFSLKNLWDIHMSLNNI